MKNLQQKVIQFVEQQNLFSPGARVLVACSGGVDSIVLLHVLCELQKTFQITVGAVHVDHMLRGQESAEDSIVVKQLCDRYGIPFFSERVPVPEILQKEGGNVQAVCREGRYERFHNIMERYEFDVLATAHHAEDQLETMMIQIGRGLVPNGMPVNRPFYDRIVVRPFLPLMKRELYQYAAHVHLQYREDPSNESDAYLRNRIRHQVLPFLLKENPLAARSAVKTSISMQQDEHLLFELAKDQVSDLVTYTEEQLPKFHRNAFLSMHPALQKRFIQLLLNCLNLNEQQAAEYSSSLMEQLLHHAKESSGNTALDLPNGYRFIREYDQLFFSKVYGAADGLQETLLEEGIWHVWGKSRFYWKCIQQNEEEPRPEDEVRFFHLPDGQLPLKVRLRRPGDRLKLAGMNHPKRLSRLLIDEKVGMSQREIQPVITTADGTVTAVPGVRYGEVFSSRPTAQTTYIWIMRTGDA